MPETYKSFGTILGTTAATSIYAGVTGTALVNAVNVSNVNKKCDYKYKDSQHNMTLYGPPLASCNTYNKEQIAMCGTPFYPINS